jgi:hypothetical protein
LIDEINDMKKANTIYEEKSKLIAQHSNPRLSDYLNYDVVILIKDAGKNPVEMKLTFAGIHPFAAPMPPENHIIKAPSILALYSKLSRWFKKSGYDVR